MAKEIWKSVKNFPNYEISNRGNVKSYKGIFSRILIQTVSTGHGYCQVTLCERGRKPQCLVHRLVLEAFIGPCPSGNYEANHKDGIKINNKLSNLEWTTRSKNCIHAAQTGLKIYTGIMNPKAKLRNEEVIEIRRLAKLGIKQILLAKMFKLSEGNVSMIVQRKTWNHI